MLRYCKNCDKEFDFPVKTMDDMNHFVCPECGNSIAKDSRKPVDTAAEKRTEEAVGRIYGAAMYLFFSFTATCAIVAGIAFYFHYDTLLYVLTCISLGFFLIKLITWMDSFLWGIALLPAGAFAGYFLFHSVQGACLGVHAVFLARYLIRRVFYKLIMKLMRLLLR